MHTVGYLSFSFIQCVVDCVHSLVVNSFLFEIEKKNELKMIRVIYFVVVLFVVKDVHCRSISMQSESSVPVPASADDNRDQFDDVLKRDKKSYLSTQFVSEFSVYFK